MKKGRHQVLFISILLTFAGLFSSPSRPSGIVAQPRNVVETFQPNKTAVRSASTNRIEAATVIVGALSQPSGLKTFGTGFIVEYAKNAYVVTCKHVVLEASSAYLVAIPRPLKTKSPPRGYAPMRLGKPVFHPSDGSTGTYDIAVLEIVGLGKKTLPSLGIFPLVISVELAEYAEGERLEAAGYPVEYANRELALGKLEPLLPLRIKGIVSQVPLENFTQSGFAGSLREGYFAQTAERPLGKGASGGPVYVDDGKDRVVGVLLGSADVRVDLDGRTTSLRGFVFASSLRIMETIKSRLPPKSGTSRRRVR